MRLDNKEIRIMTLKTHVDHGNWKDTPYISFSNCPRTIEELANYRSTRRGRGPQHIVVIDPRTRIELGLPVLHCSAEMDHYEVKAPYGRDYWQNHYLCLWEVTPAEVVGIWEWDDLRRSRNWYDEVIMPAVSRHRDLKQAVPAQRLVREEDQRQSDGEDTFDDNIPRSGSAETYNSDGGNGLKFVYESDDSYEEVCEEKLSGQLTDMFEDLGLNRE